MGKAPLQETQPCPAKPSSHLGESEACFLCNEEQRLGQVLVLSASLMGVRKPLEASRAAETGGREVPALLEHLEEGEATHVGGGVTRVRPKTLPRPPCQTSLEGVKRSTWRKEETPGAGLGGPLSGGALCPSPSSPLFPCVPPLCRPTASQAREGAVGEAPPPAAPCLRHRFPETNAPLRRPTPAFSAGSLAAGLPLVVAGQGP